MNNTQDWGSVMTTQQVSEEMGEICLDNLQPVSKVTDARLYINATEIRECLRYQ